ncbi:hypothetical protein AXG93_2956s1100 [Marchantia polymorpha subsp. ruderalis]|uniref:Uncharacterized protein n=1 Tax=Marchantia polymorpha subsp. ruderalis TaxID=1480154 RepID=A0A176WB04_MARPO|nr:hypothetical protein AXG93_2956s1100 [Marchantia polymorpha subsp. ruderalis]
MALLQLLQPHRTTYITSWQVSFVELTLAGAPVHWSRILHRDRRLRGNSISCCGDGITCAETWRGQQDAGRIAARVPRKRRWREEPEKEQHQESAALTRKRPLHEICSRPKQKARRLLLPASSAETATIAGEKESPSSEKDGTARTPNGGAD